MKLKFAIIIILAYSGLSAINAYADLLVNHPPADSFGEASDTAFTDQFGEPLWQQFADNFTFSSPATIRRVTWWGFYGGLGLPPTPPVGNETMRIRFYSARPGDGLPGDTWYEENVLNAQRIATGRNLTAIGPHVLEYRFDVNLEIPFDAQANSMYWLEIVQVGIPNSVFRWQISANVGDGDSFFNQFTPDWMFIHNDDLAFQLNTVPEPATFALIGLACCCIRARVRRKRGILLIA